MGAMTDPVRTIADRVRTRVLRDGVDLTRDESAAARYAHEEVRRYSERALSGAHAQLGDEVGTTRDVVASITGYGQLQPFFDDAEVEEIWINAPTRVLSIDSERMSDRLSNPAWRGVQECEHRPRGLHTGTQRL